MSDDNVDIIYIIRKLVPTFKTSNEVNKEI